MGIIDFYRNAERGKEKGPTLQKSKKPLRMKKKCSTKVINTHIGKMQKYNQIIQSELAGPARPFFLYTVFITYFFLKSSGEFLLLDTVL